MQLGMVRNRFGQCIGYPFIKAHAVAGGLHSNFLVKFRRNTHVETSGKRLVRFFSFAFAVFQVHFNRFRKGRFQFIDGAPLKSDHIIDVQHIAVKNIGIQVVLKAALIAFIGKNAHGYSRLLLFMKA